MDVTMNVEMDVRRLALQPGDRILVESPYRLTHEQRDHVKQTVADWAGLPPASVLMLQDNMTLRVLSKEEADVSTGNP